MKKSNQVKKGDMITMYFHGAGVTSEEKCEVLKINETTVTINDGDDGRKFNRKTGECLNDNNFMEFSRTIDPF